MHELISGQRVKTDTLLSGHGLARQRNPRFCVAGQCWSDLLNEARRGKPPPRPILWSRRLMQQILWWRSAHQAASANPPLTSADRAYRMHCLLRVRRVHEVRSPADN